MTTAEAVKELRKHLRMTQRDFASHCGLSTATIQNYEYGRAPIFRPLLRLYGISTSSGRMDLADVFAAQLLEQLREAGVELPVVGWGGAAGASPGDAR